MFYCCEFTSLSLSLNRNLLIITQKCEMKDVFHCKWCSEYKIGQLDMSETERCVTESVSQFLCRSWRRLFTHIHFVCRMKQERLRRETQEKYERSLFTPAGLKTFRLQPSIDNTSIMKVLFFRGGGGV